MCASLNRLCVFLRQLRNSSVCYAMRILLAGRVSKLFVSPEEAEMISDLVVIDPKWLIGIMQIIVELPDNCPLITGEEQQKLKSGEISLEVLKKLLDDPKDGILKSSVIDAEKLSVVLQAYCLIHSTSEMSDTKRFIIPSMLPRALPSHKIKRWDAEFYFDFERFLPIQVFHRLICMLMAAAQKSNRYDYVLSQSLSFFPKIGQCMWKVELESSEHRIKISVR